MIIIMFEAMFFIAPSALNTILIFCFERELKQFFFVFFSVLLVTVHKRWGQHLQDFDIFYRYTEYSYADIPTLPGSFPKLYEIMLRNLTPAAHRFAQLLLRDLETFG